MRENFKSLKLGGKDESEKVFLCEGAFLTRTCDPGAEYARACACRRKRAWRVGFVDSYVNF